MPVGADVPSRSPREINDLRELSHLQPADPVLSEKFFAEISKAAAGGDAQAQLAMGVYAEGIRDYSKAVSWFVKSAEQGNPKAQDRLGQPRNRTIQKLNS